MDPTSAQYADSVSQVAQNVGGSGLPVTGFDLAVLTVVGLALLALGLRLRGLHG